MNLIKSGTDPPANARSSGASDKDHWESLAGQNVAHPELFEARPRLASPVRQAEEERERNPKKFMDRGGFNGGERRFLVVPAGGGRMGPGDGLGRDAEGAGFDPVQGHPSPLDVVA